MECIFNQVDLQYEPKQGFYYRLSILLYQDGFSFLITHVITQKILSLSSYKLSPVETLPEELGGWPKRGNEYFNQLQSVNCTQQSYKRIDIAVASHKITTAPPDFFARGNATNIMSATHVIGADEAIITDPVFEEGPVTSILVPAYIPEYCATLFPGVIVKSAASVFVKGTMHQHSQATARQVFINIHRGYFEISVIQGSRLLYLNAFRYSAPADVLYYLIFLLEQLGFIPSEENITLMGDIMEGSEITEQLKIYCASIAFAERPESIQQGIAFAGVAMHTYFTLLNLSLCE